MTPIEQQVEGIVDSILEDYRHQRDIDKLDPFQHPDKAVVIDMIEKLLRIVYPGFSRDRCTRPPAQKAALRVSGTLSPMRHPHHRSRACCTVGLRSSRPSAPAAPMRR